MCDSLYLLSLFGFSLFSTTVLTPPLARLASNKKIVDLPGLHKTHLKTVPLLGGLAIFAGIIISILVFGFNNYKTFIVFNGAGVLVVTGILDDIYNIKPLVKLLGQILAASIVVFFNAGQYHFVLDTFASYDIPALPVLILIVGFIVLMINAFNLIDGLDGLAVGTALIIFGSMALIALINGGSANMLALKVIGAGACVGFLFYNFNPAKVFMGDAGSMLLGFLLAVTYLFSLGGEVSGSVVLGSMFIFAYPGLDTMFAIYRRLRNRTSIFKADKGHIHHVLMSLGYSVRKTVLLLYLASAVFAGLAILLLTLDISATSLLLIGFVTVIFTFALFRWLRIISKVNGETPEIIPEIKDKELEA